MVTSVGCRKISNFHVEIWPHYRRDNRPKVIENIVEGVFGDEAQVNPLQPLRDETYKGTLQSFENWELVFKYCAAPDFEEALQFNEYLIVQIDTDCCEEKNYGISRRDAEGNELDALQIIARVREKLIGCIGGKVWDSFGSRVIFAISVDSIECWVLVLHVRRGKKERYLNCDKHLQQELGKANIRVTIANKNSREYEKISADFSKKKHLIEAVNHNQGLRYFVEQLENLKLQPEETVYG